MTRLSLCISNDFIALSLKALFSYDQEKETFPALEHNILIAGRLNQLLSFKKITDVLEEISIWIPARYFIKQHMLKG